MVSLFTLLLCRMPTRGFRFKSQTCALEHARAHTHSHPSPSRGETWIDKNLDKCTVQQGFSLFPFSRRRPGCRNWAEVVGRGPCLPPHRLSIEALRLAQPTCRDSWWGSGTYTCRRHRAGGGRIPECSWGPAREAPQGSSSGRNPPQGMETPGEC